MVIPSLEIRLSEAGAVAAVAVAAFSSYSPSPTLTSRDLPSRQTDSVTSLCGALPAIMRASSRASLIARPSTAVMMSPDLRPAVSAGLPVCDSATSAPEADLSPRLSAIAFVTGWISTPSQPRST